MKQPPKPNMTLCEVFAQEDAEEYKPPFCITTRLRLPCATCGKPITEGQSYSSGERPYVARHFMCRIVRFDPMPPVDRSGIR